MGLGASHPSLSLQQSFRAASSFSHGTEEALEQQLEFPRLPGSDIAPSPRCRPPQHKAPSVSRGRNVTDGLSLSLWRDLKDQRGWKGEEGGRAGGWGGRRVGVRIVTMATVTSLKGLCAYPEWEFCLWGGEGKQRSDRRRHFVAESWIFLKFIIYLIFLGC